MGDLNDPNLKIKTLVLIRHGESVWNQVFNQGFGPGFLVRLVYAVLCEFYVMTMGDSLFIDSPLSRRGERQADALHSFLRTQGDPDDAFQGRKPASASAYIARSASIARQVHHGDHDSCIVSSNLRRSMGTAVLALRSRLVQKNEKILILSSLQEISRNVDTVSMAGPRAVQPSLGGTLQGLNTDKLFDAEMNAGTKVAETRGCKRIQTFVEWTFSQPKSRIIVSGHSLYFKELFKLYLPRASDHRAKKRKIANGGMVSCDIAMDSNGIVQILPNSITPVYLGFA